MNICADTHTTGPLNGLVILDLSRVLAGPYATMVLADLGARVIKVELPGSGDDARHYGPFLNDKSAYFSSLNRGKQSICLNLKVDEDRQTFEQLVGISDVLVENFRPGAMDKLGYGWDQLKELNPALIYAAVSGFGQTGPYRERPAYDMVVQAMGGIMSITGTAGDDKPVRVGTSVGDVTAGLFTTIGILAALNDRRRSGKGMMVDVGMLDCQVAILENAIARYLGLGQIPAPLGARHPSITPFEAYKSSDNYIIVAAGNNILFRKLCAVLDRQDLCADERFASNDSRTSHCEALKAEIESTLLQQSAGHWLQILNDAGIPCGPINNIEQMVNDPHVQARNMIIKTEDPVSGEVKMAGNPIKLSAYPDPVERVPAPELDQHREQILASLQARHSKTG